MSNIFTLIIIFLPVQRPLKTKPGKINRITKILNICYNNKIQLAVSHYYHLQPNCAGTQDLISSPNGCFCTLSKKFTLRNNLKRSNRFCNLDLSSPLKEENDDLFF